RFAREWRAGAVGESPLAVIDRLARVSLMHAPRQYGARVVEARGLVRGAASDIDGRCRGRKIVFGAHASGDRRAVRMDRNRQCDPDAGRYVAFPAAPRERVALPLQKAIAGLLLLAADIEERQVLVAAVDGFIEERPVALGQIDGFENGNTHRILDHA